MSISKAQPIQFWAADEQTYNEKEVCGITPVCWCQPFECDDPIVIVAPTEIIDSPGEYTVMVVDDDEVPVYTSDFFDSSGVITIIPSEAGFCDGIFQFRIVDTTALTGVLLPPEQWGTAGLTQPIKTATKFIYQTGIADGNLARQSGVVNNVTTPNAITIRVTTAGGSPSDQVKVRFEFRNVGLNVVWTGEATINGMVTDEEHTISFTKDPSFNDAIYLYVLLDNSFDVIPTFEVEITPYVSLQGGGSILTLGTPASWSDGTFVNPSADPFDTRDAEKFEVTDSGGYIANAWRNFVTPQVKTYQFPYRVVVTGTILPDDFVLVEFNANLADATGNSIVITTAGEYEQTASFDMNAAGSILQLYAQIQTTNEVTVEIFIDPNAIVYALDSIFLYKSDCIDIKESHECTNLITYSNASDFAGIPYDNQSPTPQLNIRVPSVAFHESFPREDEVQPLSNDTFRRLSSTISRKVLAEFGFMPYYMHMKLNLIFMHDYILIDDTEYVVRDPYEIVESRRSYPLKKANILLTDKNFIERNLL